MGGQLKPSNVVSIIPEISNDSYFYTIKAVFNNVPATFIGSVVSIVESPQRIFIGGFDFAFYNKENKGGIYPQGMVHEKGGGYYTQDFYGNSTHFVFSGDVFTCEMTYQYTLGGENVFAEYTKATSYLIYQDY